MAVRLDIAERGEALAIIEASRLGDLYVQAVKEGASLPPALARRAQLVYLARNAANAQEIMNSVAAVYGEARGNPMFPTIARASAIGLLNLPVKPRLPNKLQPTLNRILHHLHQRHRNLRHQMNLPKKNSTTTRARSAPILNGHQAALRIQMLWP